MIRALRLEKAIHFQRRSKKERGRDSNSFLFSCGFYFIGLVESLNYVRKGGL